MINLARMSQCDVLHALTSSFCSSLLARLARSAHSCFWFNETSVREADAAGLHHELHALTGSLARLPAAAAACIRSHFVPPRH